MLSIEVTALFARVSLGDVLIFYIKHSEGVLEVPIPIYSLTSLIRLCVENDYFLFGER